MRLSSVVLPLLLLLGSISNGAWAQGPTESEWVSTDPATGLITLLPKPDTSVLVDQLRVFKVRLQERANRLLQRAKSKSLDVKDGLITAVMPGGLLYAVYRNHEHQQAVAKADAAAEELDAIDVDITRLDVSTAPSLVALADPGPVGL
jgi:hypothetical protein